MKKLHIQTLLILLLLLTAGTMTNRAQQRRPIDNRHPLWMIHVDVWNAADPQKIIDLIPQDVRPYVCMNLSLSCGYDTETNMYRMPRCAVRTYKSWASVCQLNNMWFTCQPASGGHTHIQDDDIATFEYFFKAYPNFLGWNFAEQFWGFDEPNDESSATQASRIALFAKLVPMHHQYGGFLTVSFCGNIWSHPLNPIGMMKRNQQLLQACRDYPEAILWLYKYTTSSCFYNNESVSYGPFIAGLANNYGVRYDNCGWNGALDALLGEGNGKTYPGSAGIGTVMEQTCVNGGAVWDGPELIWTEDFQNLSNSTVDGYTRRNWGTFNNFKGIWLNMFRRIINGAMYIPSREEVISKTKIVVINDKNSGSDEDKYATWSTLYDGLYKQTDPFNRGNGQFMDNFLYMKKSGRYGAIPMVPELADDLAKSIPVQVKKSNYTSRWSTQAKKVADFDAQYPEVSSGDLYVNRFRNQLVTYTPYSYLNGKQTAQADIPLRYNTCDTLKLNWGKLSAAVIREYEDHIDFYLNNYRSDTTTVQADVITLIGTTAKPTFKATRYSTGAQGYAVGTTEQYDAETGRYTLTVSHMGPVAITLNCQGAATRTSDLSEQPISAEPLPQPQQPAAFTTGTVIIEAENMDYKSLGSVALTNSGWWATDMRDFAGMGYITTGTNTAAALRHQLKLPQAGTYRLLVRYCGATKEGRLNARINGTSYDLEILKTGKNDWRKAAITANFNKGINDLVLTNVNGINMYIDQIIYEPEGTADELFPIDVRQAEGGTVTPDVAQAAEGQTVTLTVQTKPGFALKQLRVVNSVFFTQGLTIPFSPGQTTITFVMPDEGYTIQPVFEDQSLTYSLSFNDVLNGALPAGWQTSDGNDVHAYPSTYNSGSRSFVGFTGYQGKALYWRNTSAEYGRQSGYPLTLQPGQYTLSFACAAWKNNPQYSVRILTTSGSALATSPVYSATPNAGGSTSANLSSAKTYDLEFTVTTAGRYIISFQNAGNGYDEFLLLNCILRLTGTAAVDAPRLDNPAANAVYGVSGLKRRQLQPGLNIVVGPDGRARKVINR